MLVIAPGVKVGPGTMAAEVVTERAGETLLPEGVLLVITRE